MRLIVLIAIYLGVFELASFAFWELYGAQRLQYHSRIAASPAMLAEHGRKWGDPLSMHDAQLGWVPNPGHEWIAEDGSRKAPIQVEKQEISAYGDSFVFGADVENEESFPHQLSLLIGSRVQNFGVGGYGPDKAVLYLQRHLSEGHRPKVVILGMPSENIARVVNVIRRFYIPQEGVQFYKPLFAKEGEEWRLVGDIPKWPPSAAEWDALLDTARKHDAWFAQNELRPKFNFPYSLATLRAAWFLAVDVLRWQDLYEDRRAVATMRHVLDRFVGLSERFGFLPVFVVVPMPEDLLELRAGGHAYSAAFLSGVARESRSELVVVDVLDAEFDMERFHVRPFSGHASAYGNRIVAQAIYAKLPTVNAVKH